MGIATLIALAVFCISIAGLAYIIGRKIPMLLTFQSDGGFGFSAIKNRAKDWVKHFRFVKLVSSPEVFLQTLLSKTRIYLLRFEKKTSDWLISLRKKSQEGKAGRETKKFTTNFWDKLKKKSDKQDDSLPR